MKAQTEIKGIAAVSHIPARRPGIWAGNLQNPRNSRLCAHHADSQRPSHVRGVMNLRGTVLPVVDLRMKFHLPAVEYNKFTVIVIATVGKRRSDCWWTQSPMCSWSRTTPCAKAPDFGAAVDTRFINGVFESRETPYRRVEPGRTAFGARVGAAAIHRGVAAPARMGPMKQREI